MAKTVIGYFDDYQQARRAYDQLQRNGFRKDDISIITNKDRYEASTVDDDDDHHGAAVGAGTGAVVGGAAGLALALIPGIGPIMAAGPLFTALVGAGVGAAAGGIIGALVDAGVPEEDAKLYDEGVRRGGTLLMIKADNNMAERAAQIMNQAGAVDIKRRGQQQQTGAGANRMAGQQQGQHRGNQEEHIRVPVVEEELKVGKREAAAGQSGVRVQSHVTEKPVEQQVHLREEKVNVERRPVNRPASQEDFAAHKGEESFEVREHREEAVVQKTPKVVEEVVVSKEERERVETVRDTVRRKDVEVQPIGHQGEDNDGMFREDWQRNYASSGMTFEQCAPAYRYGSQLRSNQQYRGRNWNEIESDAQRNWESRNPGTWDRMKNAVRHGWERMKDKVS
jgi:stress response protein YsnF